MAKADYSTPTHHQITLISAAAILTGPRAEYENFFDWRAEFDQNLRETTLATREGRFRNTVDALLSADTVAFWGTLRGIGYHDNSKRYVIQIESNDSETGDLQIQYIKTERTDSGNGSTVADVVGDNLGNKARIWKHTEDGGQLKYNSIPHIEPGGAGEDITDQETDDLAAELEDFIADIGKKK